MCVAPCAPSLRPPHLSHCMSLATCAHQRLTRVRRVCSHPRADLGAREPRLLSLWPRRRLLYPGSGSVPASSPLRLRQPSPLLRRHASLASLSCPLPVPRGRVCVACRGVGCFVASEQRLPLTRTCGMSGAAAGRARRRSLSRPTRRPTPKRLLAPAPPPRPSGSPRHGFSPSSSGPALVLFPRQRGVLG
eukprot:3933830-Rhodomonas_salina.2